MIHFCSIFLYKGFDGSDIISLVILAVLICISAFASGSETALFSLSPGDIRTVKNRGNKSDEAILKLLSTEDYTLATILILNNLVNIIIVILSNNIIDSLVTFTSAGWNFAFKTVLVTFILLLFGEIIPKVTASHFPLRFASIIAVPLLGVRSAFKPLSWILVKLGERFNRRAAKSHTNISMDELSDALEMTQNQSSEEKKMLTGIVDFVNTNVEDIMQPRLDITAVNVEWGFNEVRNTIVESGFSRIPAYRDSIDNIEGILYVKDMLPFIGESDDFQWQKQLREAYYIPEHKKINDLLEEFQSNKVHMAIVVDEYGSTLGLLSLEDILEEIVGEITDESDKDETFYRRLADGTYIFDGKTHIYDFLDVMQLDDDTFDDVKGEAETIAGLMLEIKRDFLKKGDSITSHGITFTVESVEKHRIEKIRIKLPETTEPTPQREANCPSTPYAEKGQQNGNPTVAPRSPAPPHQAAGKLRYRPKTGRATDNRRNDGQTDTNDNNGYHRPHGNGTKGKGMAIGGYDAGHHPAAGYGSSRFPADGKRPETHRLADLRQTA